MGYLTGLDDGSNSIGWCVLKLNDDGKPIGLVNMGARVFPDGRDPQSGSSLASKRRKERGARRNRDRYIRRRTALLNALTQAGLMPADKNSRHQVAALDPYVLRVDALHRPLEPYEIGRVLFALHKRRGFKSNRKVDGNEEDTSIIKTGITNTLSALAQEGHPTFGSWLASRNALNAGVRFRRIGVGKNATYPYYPAREMIEAEFDAVWSAQSAWNPELSVELRETLHGIIFRQRPLRPCKAKRCRLEPGERCALKALPTFQRFRIAQDLANLRVRVAGEPERPLTSDERITLASILERGSNLKLDQVRKKLRLSDMTDFSKTDELVGCETAAILRKKKNIGSDWHKLSLATQDAIFSALDSDDDETAIQTMMALGLSRQTAAVASEVSFKRSRASLSLVAMSRILPHLQAGMTYADAEQAAGYAHHSDRRTGRVMDHLPYYGEILAPRMGTGTNEEQDATEVRYGKAPNPTVHLALNQLRCLVNEIIALYGLPDEIVVETMRELKWGKAQKKAYEKEQKENREANDRRRETLVNLGYPVNARNLMRLRLLDEQGSSPDTRVCPYTGTLITPAMALSDAVEDDHLLPYAQSLDDSAANRVLAMRDANREKGKRTPFDAFGHTDEWPEILKRAKNLPENKRWRFAPDAMFKLARNGDFLARHLSDSATIARWTAEYLQAICPQVRTVPGRLTSLLRQALGLNSKSVLGKGPARKDRKDHRHHAIDAVVVALTDRSLLNRVSRAAKDGAEGRLIGDIPEPWPGFVNDVAEMAQRIVVSYKRNTGVKNALHKATNYGPIAGAGPKDPNVVVRQRLEVLAGWSRDEILAHVRDPAMALRIADALEGKSGSERRAALATFTDAAGNLVRRIRTVERLNNTRGIASRETGRIYRMVELRNNHCAEIWRMPDGSISSQIVAAIDAAQDSEAKRLGRPVVDRRPHPAAKLVMRLFRDDTIARNLDGAKKLFRVVKMSGNSVTLAAPNEAGKLAERSKDPKDDFKFESVDLKRLASEGATKVCVTAAGKVMWGKSTNDV